MNETTVRVNRVAASFALTLAEHLRTGPRPRCMCMRAHVYSGWQRRGVPA